MRLGSMLTTPKQPISETNIMPKVSQNQKIALKSLKNQGRIDCFLRLSWCCTLWVPSAGSNSQQGILFECYTSFAWNYSLKEAVIVVRPLWFLHHNNALSHTTFILHDRFIKISTHILPQTLYNTWFGTVRLLVIQQTQKTTSGTLFWVDREDSSRVKEGAEGHPGN